MTSANGTKAPFQLKGWHVLLILLGFFGSVFAVDGAMMYHAYATFPGEVSARPYEEGLGFNAELRREAAAKTLGWTSTLDNIRDGDRVRLMFGVKDRNGRPVSGLKIQAQLSRTVTLIGAQTLAFREGAPGVYEADARAQTGLWEVQLKAPTADGKLFEAEQRIVWP